MLAILRRSTTGSNHEMKHNPAMIKQEEEIMDTTLCTTPSLFRQLATLPRLLTKEERERVPGWYLVRGNGPRRIASAPTGSPFSERMKRRCVGAANVLWWPIAKVLTVFFFLRDGLPPEIAHAWWRAIAAHRCVGSMDGTSMMCSALCARRGPGLCRASELSARDALYSCPRVPPVIPPPFQTNTSCFAAQSTPQEHPLSSAHLPPVKHRFKAALETALPKNRQNKR